LTCRFGLIGLATLKFKSTIWSSGMSQNLQLLQPSELSFCNRAERNIPGGTNIEFPSFEFS
jgi:hypothetical protein